MSTEAVLGLIRDERIRQEERYGETNDDLVNGTGPETRWLLPYTADPAALIEARVRDDYEEYQEDAGLPTWCHLVREEVAEAFKEDDPMRLAEELIQVAALAASWVERLRAKQENWHWGISTEHGEITPDADWRCAADAMASAHGFGPGPYKVYVKRPGDMEWQLFWDKDRELVRGGS